MSTEHIPLRAHVLSKMDAPSIARAALLEQEEDPSSAMDKGTTTHAIVFNTQTVVVYGADSDKKKVRNGAEWDRFAAEHDGCRIVLRGEYEVASRMADAVRRNKFARTLLEGATFEQTRLFKLDGRLCRATPDIVGRDYIADLKTGRSADPRRFRYNAREYCYDASLAWYKRSVPEAKNVFIICVEKTRPYPVSVFRLTERTLAQGDALNMEAFARFRECERTGIWPDYVDGIVDLDIPERTVQSVAYEEATSEAA